MGRVVVVGSANLDLVATTPRIPAPGETVLGTDYQEFPGGKGLNQAVAAARQGADVRFIGAVGGDPAGLTLRRIADAESITTSELSTHPNVATGRALIGVDAAGENSIIVVPGANELVALPPDHEAFAHCDVLLAQLEVPLDVVTEAVGRARASGAMTILNPAPAAMLSPELLAGIDLLLPNEHELEQLGEVERLLDAGVGAVAVTLGARGIEVTVGDAWRGSDAPGAWTQPPHRVHPVDTTGAGDACCGTVAAALADGLDVRAAVKRAAVAGALATTLTGAVPSLPTRETVDAALA